MGHFGDKRSHICVAFVEDIDEGAVEMVAENLTVCVEVGGALIEKGKCSVVARSENMLHRLQCHGFVVGWCRQRDPLLGMGMQIGEDTKYSLTKITYA